MGPKIEDRESLSQLQSQFQSQSQSPQQQRWRETVAVIGSGMAGLVTAHLLVCDNKKREDEEGETGRFEVEVLEMQEKLSLDSASYTLPPSLSASMIGKEDEKSGSKDGQRVDLPMRAFAAGYYDNLRKMYEYLGVRFAEPKFVYSLSTLPDDSGNSISTSSLCQEKKRGQKEKGNDNDGDGIYFIHSSNNHILPPIRPSGVGAAKWMLEIAYLLFWYAWFTAACFLVVPKVASRSGSGLKEKSAAGETLGAYLTRVKIPRYYTWRYLLPLMSSITTCTHHELLNFPASDIVGYARQTYRKPHYTVTGGVQAAEAKLSSGLSVKFNTRVTNVESIEGGEKVRVSWKTAQGKAESKVYDRAIIAVTPDVVGKIFAPLTDAMSVIPTTTVQTVVHRDISRVRGYSAYLRDNSRLQKRKFKSLLDSSPPSPPSAAADSVPPLTAMHMVTDVAGARTESIHEHPAQVLVTTYAMDGGIDESKILHRVDFTRVLRSAQSQAVVNSIFGAEDDSAVEMDNKPNRAWKSGDGNVFIVGGWCWDGMVLLEGCIVSAMRVADALGVDVPWTR